jgi:hypothetical protein
MSPEETRGSKGRRRAADLGEDSGPCRCAIAPWSSLRSFSARDAPRTSEVSARDSKRLPAAHAPPQNFGSSRSASRCELGARRSRRQRRRDGRSTSIRVPGHPRSKDGSPRAPMLDQMIQRRLPADSALASSSTSIPCTARRVVRIFRKAAPSTWSSDASESLSLRRQSRATPVEERCNSSATTARLTFRRTERGALRRSTPGPVRMDVGTT